MLSPVTLDVVVLSILNPKLSVLSFEPIARSNLVSGKGDAGGPKRRVKSARRAGKSVSFMDESNLHPPVPAIDLVPKEEIIPDAVSNSYCL